MKTFESHSSLNSITKKIDVSLFLLDDGDVEIIGTRAWLMAIITDHVSNPTGVILGTVYAFGLKVHTNECIFIAYGIIGDANDLTWYDKIFMIIFL